MRRFKLAAIGLALLVGAQLAVAELPVPRLSGRVVDNAKLFSAADERRITATLEQLQAAPNGAQMAVLTVPSLKHDSLELFSIRVVEAWKLGKKDVDNGLLLLISRDDRQMRLEVGYGLEGKLTDARCGDIIRSMGPYFRKQRFADGVLCAIGSVQEQLTGSRPSGVPAVPRSTSGKRKGFDPFFLIILFFVFVLPAIRHRRLGLGHTIFLVGGHRGGGFGGGGFGGGGFSGGGGGFGGGGASGGW